MRSSPYQSVHPILGLRVRDLLREATHALEAAATQPRLTARAAAALGKEVVAVLRNQSALLPETKDRRFADPDWLENRHYRHWLQSYLALGQVIDRWVAEQNLDDAARARLAFVAGLLVDALAPSNFPWQPEAVKRFRETGGRSARDGLRNLMRHVRENRGLPLQVDKSRFEIGKNVAATPGAVVARTDLFELIQYAPVTESVRELPLLIVPPQINKYYVFDLSPEKSVVRKLLQHGHQVFVMSWRNPTAEHRHWGLEDYTGAIESAVTTACHIARTSSLNLAGACAGGLTLAYYAAARAALGDVRASSLTFLVSVLDTNALGDTALGMFATTASIEAARQASFARGFLDGKDMAATFAWLRPNDLVWNYWVNNVLLGKDPPAFDVLFWNNDTTRLPARLHADFLDLFGGAPLHLHGVPIDLSQIRCDSYFISGITDHLTPWQACYRGARRIGGRSTFVLSNSGHIQSILNPPGNRKAQFWCGVADADDPDAWLESAPRHPDSWWPNWHAWLDARAGASRPAPRDLGCSDHPPLAPAPGRYVLE